MIRQWALLILSACSCLASAQLNGTADAQTNYRMLIGEVGSPELRRNLDKLGGFGSRLAGSPGEQAVLKFLEKEFERLGLKNIRKEPFKVTIPDPDAKGILAGRSWRATVFPLWPNLVRTSTCNVSGPLVYGKFGTLAELSGRQIDGAIVVLEFASGSNWKNAIKLGAKAVIFIEPETMERTDAEQKFSSAPVDAPRFYLPLKDAGEVLRGAFSGESATLRCRQDWVVRDTYNLFADLDGADQSLNAERIVVAAPVDSMSVVPALAPGAAGVASVAGMLQIARIAARESGRRPMTFAAISGNALALQGWREYAERRIQEGKKSFLHVTLDLNDESATLGAFGRSWYWDYRNEALDPIRNLTRVLRAHADSLAPLFGVPNGRFVMLDAANDSDGRTWRNTIYAKCAFGCEPLTMAGINAITFAAVENARQRVDTPFDTVDRLDVENLRRQIQTIACMIWHISRDTSDLGELSNDKVPVELRRPVRQSLTGGASIIEGQVAQFDPNKSFVADIPVPDALTVLASTDRSYAGVRGAMIQKVDPKSAHYRFLGIPPSSAYFYYDNKITTLAAYACDLISGQIVIAPTEEMLGHRYDNSFRLVTSYRSLPIVVFPCAAVTFFDLTDPQELTALYTYRAFDPEGDSQPRNLSMGFPAYNPKFGTDYEDCAALFLEKGAHYKLLMGALPGEWRLMLTNGIPQNPFGEGYVAESGVFRDLPLKSAQDIVTINDSRLAAFSKYRILNPGLEDLQNKAKTALAGAQVSKAAKDWKTFDSESRAAWAYALRAHPLIQGTVNDVVNGVLFYLALLIPFSYFLERLLFARRKLTVQLFFAIGIFIAAFLILRFVHPAFEVVSNPSMIFVAFVMGSLSVLVTTFIVGKFEASLREMRARQTGLGHIDVGRMSVAMAAFNLGIANMRRRKARTFLTTLTLVVMTFIVLSFTSIVPGLSIAETPSDNPAVYPGILIRNPGLEPLEASAFRMAKSEFGTQAEVVRREWYYGAEVSDSAVLTLRSADQTVDAKTIIGMEPGEVSVSSIGSALLPGGRWIKEEDRDVALLPFSVAQKLHISEADVGKAQVEFSGRTLTVVGILDDARLRGATDLDGESVLPADFSLSKKFQAEYGSTSQAFRKYLRIDPGSTFIAPLALVHSLGGQIRSIAARFHDENQTAKALKSLMPRLRKNLYAAVPGSSGLEVRQYSVLQGSKSAGLGLVLIQMLISAVFVLNTMVASVHERKREIGIFSSVGLAPNHIAVLFFAESCVYGVLGAVIGYFLAQGAARFLIQTGLIPGLYLNFSATSAVLAAGIVLAVVLLSTIYPARVASRLAAPAYESEIESEPEGDQWSILLPFRVNQADAEPLIQFFADWLQGHQEHAIGEFVTGETSWEEIDPKRRELRSTVWLSPFDLGVSQKIRIVAAPGPAKDVVELTLELERIAGEPDNWVNLNKRFLVTIRKQFLAWRTRPKGSEVMRGEVME